MGPIRTRGFESVVEHIVWRIMWYAILLNLRKEFSALADLGGGGGWDAPTGPKFFIFMQFSAKISQVGWRPLWRWHPLLVNFGSATYIYLQEQIKKFIVDVEIFSSSTKRYFYWAKISSWYWMTLLVDFNYHGDRSLCFICYQIECNWLYCGKNLVELGLMGSINTSKK